MPLTDEDDPSIGRYRKMRNYGAIPNRPLSLQIQIRIRSRAAIDPEKIVLVLNLTSLRIRTDHEIEIEKMKLVSEIFLKEILFVFPIFLRAHHRLSMSTYRYTETDFAIHSKQVMCAERGT